MKHQVIARRAFFKTVVRGTGISSLVALSTVLITRSRSQGCINLGLCGGCKAFPACELPPAQQKKNQDGRSTKRDRR